MTHQDSKSEGLGLEFSDQEQSPEELESRISDEMSAEQAEQINQKVNEIPRFVKTKDRPSLNSKTVTHHLEAARRALAQAETKPNLAPSPATATPVLGSLWGRIRGQMHELVLFYVNRLGSTSSRVDAQLIEAVEELTALVEEQQREIEKLKSR